MIQHEYRGVQVTIHEEVDVVLPDGYKYTFTISTAQDMCTALTEALHELAIKQSFEGNLFDGNEERCIITDMQGYYLYHSHPVVLRDEDHFHDIVYGDLKWDDVKNAWLIDSNGDYEDYYLTIDEMRRVVHIS